MICDSVLFIKSKGFQLGAIGLSSHSETMFCVDRKGRLVRPVISWLDGRSKKCGRLFDKEFSTDYIYEYSGQPNVYPFDFACRILWLKRNEPNNFKKTHIFLQPKDFIIYKLTGKFSGCFSLFSSSLLLDIKNKQWVNRVLEFLDIEETNLPTLNYSCHNVGNINYKLLDELDLNEEIPVINGCMDQVCSAIACGNIDLTPIFGPVFKLVS